MGIVQKQASLNTIITYIGFAFGAINTLFLYTEFVDKSYYGLIVVILSWGLIIMPFMNFGFHNTLIKFYSSFKTKERLNTFLTYVLVFPLLFSLVIALIIKLNYNWFANFVSNESKLASNYIWHIFIAGLSMAYFEMFYSWAKVHLQSVFGNFMKEVFHRVAIMCLLFAVYFKWLTVYQLIDAIVIVYAVRVVIMMLYAFSLRLPKFSFKILDNTSAIFKYSFLILIAGSVAVMLLDIDKVMIGRLLKIENVAFYSVAIYIASVIAVPARAMHQITNPLTAQYLNSGNTEELKSLYKKSSLNLFIISGFIFLIIILNVNELYEIIKEEYRGGFYIVLLIGIVKLYDNVLGNNNSILFNSDYYRMVLTTGVLLAILTVIFNLVFIPKFGIEGAAIATFLAIFIYNTVKLIFVQWKFKIHPFSKQTLKSLVLILVILAGLIFWEFPFHPILNIALKSILITIIYGVVVYKLNLSEDINTLINRILKINNG